MDARIIPSKAKEILCIEKRPEICQLLSLILPQNEFHVSLALDMEQADVQVEACHPALVVIENVFFKNTILTYVGQLKALHPETKVIFLSAEGGALKESVLNAGADAFLLKPFTKTELLDSVLSLVDTTKDV